MADLTADRKTDKFNPEDCVIPNVLEIPCYQSTAFFAGLMGGFNASGYAVTATASTTRILGRVEADVSNASGASAAKSVKIRPGAFYWDNDTSLPVRQADLGQPCYAVDNHTVSRSSSSGSYPLAGLAFSIRSDGQVAVQMGLGSANPYAATDTKQSRFYARGSTITNHSLTAFTVATNTDGITYVAGDIVLLCGQTNAAQNGPYVVGTVSTTAALTRPTWWATGSYVPMGAVFELGPEGTLRGGMSYKSFVTTATVVIGTTTPLLYPQYIMGAVALSTGTATVSNLSITSQAYVLCNDVTTLTKTAYGTLSAGADQGGSLAITGYGTGTDSINYLITNW